LAVFRTASAPAGESVAFQEHRLAGVFDQYKPEKGFASSASSISTLPNRIRSQPIHWAVAPTLKR